MEDADAYDARGLNAERAMLERRWGYAAAEVIHAQRKYAGLVSEGAADEETVIARPSDWWS